MEQDHGERSQTAPESSKAARIDESTAKQPAFEGLRDASDFITEKLGLARIEGFSFSSFFSQVFKKHDPNEVENLFTVGSSITTPELHPRMEVMPNPWMFFRVLVGTLIVYLAFYLSWQELKNPIVLPGLIMVGSFAVPFATLILFFEINTPRNVSVVRLIQLVGLGGAVSILLSLVLFNLTNLDGLFGASSAGIIEEFGKLLAVLLAMRLLTKARYPYRLNYLLIGAAIGTGFAAFESAGYAFYYGLLQGGPDVMIDTITVRGVLSPFAHVAWTAIATCAYWDARQKNPDFWSTIGSREFLRLFAVPVGLHFVWNTDWTGPLFVKYWILGFVAWVVLFSLIQSGLREVGELARKDSGALLPHNPTGETVEETLRS